MALPRETQSLGTNGTGPLEPQIYGIAGFVPCGSTQAGTA